MWPYATSTAPNYSIGELFISALNLLAHWIGGL
jgi:hypothetical protein